MKTRAKIRKRGIAALELNIAGIGKRFVKWVRSVFPSRDEAIAP
jgi:hypothetical protein